MSRNVTFMLDARGDWLNNTRNTGIDRTKLFWVLQAALIRELLEIKNQTALYPDMEIDIELDE